MNTQREKVIYDKALALSQSKDYSKAIELLRQLPEVALSIDSRLLLGSNLADSGEYESAIQYLIPATTLEPQNYMAHFILGRVYETADNFTKAETCYNRLIELDPKRQDGYMRLARLYDSWKKVDKVCEICNSAENTLSKSEEIKEFHANILRNSGQPEKALEIYNTITNRKNVLKANSNRLLCLNYLKLPPQKLYNEHINWEKLCAKISSIPEKVYNITPDSNRKIKIGYVSADFRKHSVAYFVESLIHFHDRRKFDVNLFYDLNINDDTTKRFRKSADNFYETGTMPIERACEFIRSKKMDVLIDLGSHTGRLMEAFSRRMAPIQITYMGYPNTTGLTNMDYRFADNLADLPENNNLFTEKQLIINGGMWAYSPLIDAPEPGPLPYLTNGIFTFGSFNNIAKFSNDTIRCWGRILKEAPNSRMLLKNKYLEDSSVKQHLISQFTAVGANANQLLFSPGIPEMRDHLALYNEIDLALDTFPYNGTTTTFEALWMGTPVLTLEGEAHGARVGKSILSRAGLDSLVAKSRGSYVKAAIMYASKPETLAPLRPALRNILIDSGQCDGQRVTREIEHHILSIFQ